MATSPAIIRSRPPPERSLHQLGPAPADEAHLRVLGRFELHLGGCRREVPWQVRRVLGLLAVAGPTLPRATVAVVSAQTGEGVPELRRLLAERVAGLLRGEELDPSDGDVPEVPDAPEPAPEDAAALRARLPSLVDAPGTAETAVSWAD